jgi:hypothetical protein
MRWAIVVLLLVGCGDDSWVEIRGEHVSLRHRPGTLVCGGTIGYLDRAAEAIGRALELPLPRSIPYYYVDEVSAQCETTRALGCASGRPASVWATYPTSAHELVHAIQTDSTGYSPSFLMEGVAVALGEGRVTAVRPETPDDALLVPGQQLAPELYGTAGDFVSYLLTEYGPARFEQLIGSVGFESPVADVQAAFVRVYGKNLGELREERARSPRKFPGNRLWTTECQGLPATPLTAAGLQIATSVSCAGDATGPNNGGISQLHVLDVAEAGPYAFSATAPDESHLLLSRCRDVTMEYDSKAMSGGGSAKVIGHLTSGRYLVSFLAPLTIDPAPVTLSLGPAPTTNEPACRPDTAQLAVEAGTKRVVLFAFDGVREVAFTVDRPRLAWGIARFLFSTGASICSPACSENCTGASALFGMKLSPDATYSLKAEFSDANDSVGLTFD